MRKINLGCGLNILGDGWENYDSNVDISKPLPFENESTDFILVEHALEHIGPHAGIQFLREAYRILKPNGVIRIVVPSVSKIVNNRTTPEFKVYSEFIGDPRRGWGNSSLQGVVEAVVTQHGHLCMYSEDLLISLCVAFGFEAKSVNLYESEHEALRNVEGHWKIVPKVVNDYESMCVEATKK